MEETKWNFYLGFIFLCLIPIFQANEEQLDCKNFAKQAIKFNETCCEMPNAYDSDIIAMAEIKTQEWIKKNEWYSNFTVEYIKKPIIRRVHRDKLSKAAGFVDEISHEFNLDKFENYTKTTVTLAHVSKMLVAFAEKCIKLEKSLSIKDIQEQKIGLRPTELDYTPQFILRCISLNFVKASSLANYLF
jgi:hypothetical protein